MIKFLFVIFLLTPVCVIAQKTKRIDVARIQFASITAYVRFDSENKAADTSYVLYGQDTRYKTIVDLYRIKEGSLADVYLFIKKCRTFLKEEETGVSSDIDDVHVSVDMLMGLKYITLWNPEKHSSGYTDLSGPQLNKLMDAILYHCKKYNLKIIVPKD